MIFSFLVRRTTYLSAYPLSCAWARLDEYRQLVMTSLLSTSWRIRITADGVNSGKGSVTARGETPVSSGRPMSFMVYTLEGGEKSMCLAGSKASLEAGEGPGEGDLAVHIGAAVEERTSAAAIVMLYSSEC